MQATTPLPRRMALLGLFALALLILPRQAPSSDASTTRARPDRATSLGTGRLDAPGGEPVFVRGALDVTIEAPTSLAFGPDGRLYVAALTEIRALTLDPSTQEVLAVEQIASGLEDVTGIAFDPTAAPSPVTVYASRREPGATAGFDSRVSTFTAPTWERDDVITGLPTSRPFFNHLTNGLAFDSAGRLFIAQGSSTDAGLADGTYWPETPLSAAVLIAPIHDPGFDGAITYDPPGSPADDTVDQVGGDVSVYAAGLRNPYDLVVHTNGSIYATDNGPAELAVSISCTQSALRGNAADELNLVEPGNYYGHPNRNRGRSDPRQCAYRAPQEGDGTDFTGPIAVLPPHCSCDGLAEYTAAAFGSAMQGDLIYAQWSFGALARAQLSSDGRSVLATSVLASGLGQPLDVTVGPSGTIYVAEHKAGRVSYLAPDSDRDGCADGRELEAPAELGGGRDPKDFWDFFDTPDPSATPPRDGSVTADDVFRVAARFGATGDPTIDPLSTPASTGYHPAYDRTPAPPGGSPLAIGPPDGAIAMPDVFAVAAQFGHRCV